MDIWRSAEDSIHQRNEQKMITSQECLQMKRDLEAKLSDFEISPLTLSLMITLLLFGIGFWIWLISWSCIFDKPMGNNQKIKEKSIRLSGGKSNRFQNTEGRLSEFSVQSAHLRRCPPITCHDIPDFDHISYLSLPVARSNPESFRQVESGSSRGLATSTTPRMETLMYCEAGIPNASGLGKENLGPKKKYNIQWTKFLRRDRRDDSDN